MKKSLLALYLIAGLICRGQSETEPLYKRFPTVPPLRLLLTDSSTVFTDKDVKKNMPVLIMVFSPDCDHCQHHAEELVKNKEIVEGIQIIMATMQPFSKMKDFFSAYQLDKMPNVIMGQDREFILSTFYKMKSLPFLAFYNRKGKLIDVFEGPLPVHKIPAVFEK